MAMEDLNKYKRYVDPEGHQYVHEDLYKELQCELADKKGSTNQLSSAIVDYKMIVSKLEGTLEVLRAKNTTLERQIKDAKMNHDFNVKTLSNRKQQNEELEVLIQSHSNTIRLFKQLFKDLM